MKKEILNKGNYTICCLLNEKTGRCEIVNFLDELEKQNCSEHNKVVNLLHRMSMNESIRKNPEKFRWEEDGIFTIKSFQIRLYGFMDKSELILTHGCVKKSSRADPNELRKAKKMRQEFLGGG